MALQLTSPAFDAGGTIPDQYGYRHENVSPPLRVSGVPDDAVTLALVVDDPDAVKPAGKVWDHWVVWNLPADVGEVPEGSLPGGASEGRNSYGERGYGGPNPPDGEHTYRFRLSALDTALDLPADATKADLEAAIEGHVLAETTLTGTYAP